MFAILFLSCFYLFIFVVCFVLSVCLLTVLCRRFVLSCLSVYLLLFVNCFVLLRMFIVIPFVSLKKKKKLR